MKNDLNDLYNSLSDQELLTIMNEIEEAEATGSFPQDSAIRSLSKKASDITGTDVSSVLMLTQINVLRQAAFRWKKSF